MPLSVVTTLAWNITHDGACTCAGSPGRVWRIMRAFVLPIDSHLNR
jgi:hypothetical protein